MKNSIYKLILSVVDMRLMSLIIIVMGFSLIANAQTPTKVYEAYIKTLTLKKIPNDVTARTSPVVDNSGEHCALIEVSLISADNYNLEFNGDIFRKDTIDNHHIRLWVLDRTSEIEITGNNMHPVDIKFADYDKDIKELEGKVTYQLDITIGYKVYKETTVYIEKLPRWFVNYQFQYARQLGINIGRCKKFGFFAFLSVNSDILSTEMSDAESDYDDDDFVTFGVGPMVMITPHLYLQAGIGLGTDLSEWWFSGVGATIMYRIRHFNVGAGYYYNRLSSLYGRNAFLDGLTVQLGFNF